MRIARVVAISLFAAAVAFVPVWAQNTQQAPPTPPAGAAARGSTGNRAGRGGRFGAGRFGPARGPGMAGVRGGRGMMQPGRMAGLGGSLSGFGAGLARIVNNATLRQQLGITDAQAAKIRQQTSDFQVASIRSQAEVQVNQVQLRNLLAAENPDSAAINQKLEQVSAAQLAQRKQEVSYLLAMRDVLTPAQRQKLQQMRQTRSGATTQAAPSTSTPAPAQGNQ